MRSAAAVAFAVVFSGCDEASVRGDVSPITKIPGLPLPKAVAPIAVEPMPVDAGTPAPAPPPQTREDPREDPSAEPREDPNAKKPGAGDLASNFEVALSSSNARAMAKTKITIKGTAAGGELDETDESRRAKEWKAPIHARLSAKQVSAFLAAIDALDWWKLNSVHAEISDASDEEVSIRRGRSSHSFSMYGGCASSFARRPNQPRDESYVCHQQDVIRLIWRSAEEVQPKPTSKSKRGR